MQKDSGDIEDDYELDSVDDQDKEEQMDDMQENEEDSETDSTIDVNNFKSDSTSDDNVDSIGKYVWKIDGKNNRNHSPLLPRDIRAIIVGKSGAGKSVFLTYLLLEPNMMDYDNLIVCGPSLHQPLYNILNKGFSMNLSKEQVRAIFENQDMVKDEYGTADNLLDNYKMRCKGGLIQSLLMMLI